METLRREMSGELNSTKTSRTGNMGPGAELLSQQREQRPSRERALHVPVRPRVPEKSPERPEYGYIPLHIEMPLPPPPRREREAPREESNRGVLIIDFA